MARYQSVQTNFRVGQISPRLQGYIDLPDYQNGVKTLENMVVLPQSSITRRPGTKYVSTTYSNVESRLIPFNFGQGESYMLEFSAGRIRIFYNDPADGEPKLIPDGTGDSSNGLTTYLDIDEASQSIPYQTSDLPDINWAQSADTLFLAHPSHPPLRLKRSGPNISDWSVDEFPFKNGPFLPVNSELTWLRPTGLATSDYNNPKVGEVPNGSNDYVSTTSGALTLTNHGLVDGEIVYLDNDIPNGFTANLDYFVVQATTNTFKLSLSRDGDPIIPSSNGSTGNSTHVHKRFIASGAVVTFEAYLGAKIEQCTFTQASGSPANTFTTVDPHGLSDGQVVRFKTGVVDGFSLDTDYYVTSAATNTFKLTLDPVDPAISVAGSETVSVGGLYKMTASGEHINDGDGFSSSDVGRLIRLNTSVQPAIKWGYGRIQSVNSSVDSDDRKYSIEVKVIEDLGPAEETQFWALGAFSETSGYPRCVAIYQQRMVFAGTEEEPQSVHFSKTGDYDNFATTEPIGQQSGTGVGGSPIFEEQIYDDNAIVLAISSDTVDRITYLVPSEQLTIGTTGGIFQMFGARDDITLTPFNFSVIKIAAWASNPSRPVEIGNTLLYTQQNGRKIRALDYSKAQDEYSADDLTIRSDDITVSGIKEMVYQDQPNALVWCRRDDGKLACLTFISSVPLIAWHLHTIGGSFGESNAVVESIGVIPQTDHDQLWMIVKRTINGSTVRYVEVLQKFFDGTEIEVEDAWFVDSGKKDSSGTAYSTVTLSHLPLETLTILGDGGPQPIRTADATGEITLQLPAVKTIVGLGYESTIQTLPIVIGDRRNTNFGQRKRIHRMFVQLLESMGLKYGTELDNLFEEDFMTTADLLDNRVPLFTGQKELVMPSAFTRTGEVYLRQDRALPMTVTLIALDYETND